VPSITQSGGVGIEEMDQRQVVGQAARQIPFEDRDHLHRQVHAAPPGRHGEQETSFRHHQLRPIRRLDLVARQGLEAFLEPVQQGVRIEEPHHFGLAEMENGKVALADLGRARHAKSPPLHKNSAAIAS